MITIGSRTRSFDPKEPAVEEVGLPPTCMSKRAKVLFPELLGSAEGVICPVIRDYSVLFHLVEHPPRS